MAGKKIIISLTIFLTLLSPAIQAQIISLTGKVVDAKGNPVVSDSLRIINSDQGTSSDSLGIFSLRIKQGNSVLVSAIGYADMVFSAVNRVGLLIVLQPKAKALQEVVVSGANQTTEIASPEEVPREQIIASTFESYLREAEFSNGIYVISKLGSVGISRIILTGFGGLNTLNSGVTLPDVEHKEDTKGSRYLLNRFSRGRIVDQNNKFITDSNNLLNYDKIDRRLMVAVGDNKYLAVDKEKVIAFAFKVGDTSFVFLNVPILNNNDYFLLIATGPKYSA
jgi:CarboxypepD_reg-like domain